ncbi:MAG: GTP 3',8-cyclase MoaA [Candidatus Bathyarchaeia archaeon]
MLIDPCGRPVESIRISVTQRCNLSCFYCHREGEDIKHGEEMTPEEIKRIVEVAASFSIKKVKLTGGEPLARKDIVEIVQKIWSTRGVEEISMTTNGVLLAKCAQRLKDAGLARVNVSLGTLNPEKFKQITCVDAFEKVIMGIQTAAKVGLKPVKVNMVLLRNINEDEVSDMIRFTAENGLILQIIELETPNETEAYKKYHVKLNDVKFFLEAMAEKVVIREMHHRRKYFLKGGGEVEVVNPMHNTEFCKYCNRIRVTSDGKLKPCLLRNDNLVDFVGPLRQGASNDTLKALFVEAVNKRKPFFT